jgi:SAM-dependent methyltransferase
MPDRERARELATESLRRGDPLGWFEQLYQEAEQGKCEVPWADLCPNPHLLDFWKTCPQQMVGKTALVIGSGVGDDSEQLAAWGFQTTAFDISETAVQVTHRRFPNTHVEYLVADLLDPPATWHHNFDLVLEVYTLQVLPEKLRPLAIEKIAGFLKPAGSLLVIARGRDQADPSGEMPWPLTREELQEFTRAGLKEVSFEDYLDPEDPHVRRFRALYTNAHSAKD